VNPAEITMASPVEVLPLSPTQPTLEYDNSPLLATIERGSIQAGHRLAAVAIFATLGAWIIIYQGQSDHWAGAIAMAASDLGLCLALVAGVLARRQGRKPSPETLSVFIANLVLVALSVQLMLFARLDLFRTAIEKFFAPS
jgi:MFS family permease